MVTLDGGTFVDDLEFILVLGDFELVDWHNAHDGEQGALGLPALRASAGMVMRDVAAQGDLYGIRGAVALKFAAAEVGVAFLEAVVDGGVERGHSGCLCWLCVLMVVCEVVAVVVYKREQCCEVSRDQ